MLLADEPTGALDSSSSAEILELFDELNAQGVTIVMVTHDREVSTRTMRIVTMKDARIVDAVLTSRASRSCEVA